jgi:hypothetical protein
MQHAHLGRQALGAAVGSRRRERHAGRRPLLPLERWPKHLLSLALRALQRQRVQLQLAPLGLHLLSDDACL